MNCVFFKIKRALLVCLSFCFLIHSGYSIAEDICAEVKIEILQEFAIERQAFEGVMRINNKLDTYKFR